MERSPLTMNSVTSRHTAAAEAYKRRAQSLVVEEALSGADYLPIKTMRPRMATMVEGIPGYNEPNAEALQPLHIHGTHRSSIDSFPSYSAMEKAVGMKRRRWVELLKRMPPAKWVQKQFEIEDSAKRVDYISRFLFPLAFILFNLVYWLLYSRYEIHWPWL